MHNDTIFCNSFVFNLHRFMQYRYTDNHLGQNIYYFAYMIEGTAKIRTKTETVFIRPGDIFFIPEGCSYRSYWYGNSKIQFISLGFSYFPNFENRFYGVQVLPPQTEAVKVMQSIIERGVVDSVAVGQFYTLVSMLLPTMVWQAKNRHAALIERVERLIFENPQATVSELAKACAVSESSLYSIFKKHSGKSIKKVKTAVMMEKAKELLISTDRTVEDISRTLGFSSDAYFRKCFKDTYGISPRAFRKSYTI